MFLCDAPLRAFALYNVCIMRVVLCVTYIMCDACVCGMLCVLCCVSYDVVCIVYCILMLYACYV